MAVAVIGLGVSSFAGSPGSFRGAALEDRG